jgi:hypothetical protein
VPPENVVKSMPAYGLYDLSRSRRVRFEETIHCFLDLVEAAKHYPGLKKQWIEFLGEQPNPATDRIETSDVEAEPLTV